MFCSHFYDVVLLFVLTQIAQPLHEDIINITLSIVILRTTPPPIWFLSCTNHLGWVVFFFSLQIPIVFLYHHTWFLELQTMFLLPQLKGNSWCLMVLAMEGKKGVAPSSKLLERNHWWSRIRIKIFWFFISAHPILHLKVNVIFVS